MIRHPHRSEGDPHADDVRFGIRFRDVCLLWVLELCGLVYLLLGVYGALLGAMVGAVAEPLLGWRSGALLGFIGVYAGFGVSIGASAVIAYVRGRAWEVRCRLFLHAGRVIVETQELCSILTDANVITLRRWFGTTYVYSRMGTFCVPSDALRQRPRISAAVEALVPRGQIVL